MNKKSKKILVIYQDWDDMFLNNISKFDYWFDRMDGAYDKNNTYYILSFGLSEKKIQLRDNVIVEYVKSSPKKQLLDIFKYHRKLKQVIEDFKPNYIYNWFLYLGSAIPKKRNLKVISFLRDKTPEMIRGKGGIRSLLGFYFYFLDYLSMKRTDILLYNGESLAKYAKKLGFKKKMIFCPRPIADIDSFKIKNNENLIEKYNLKNKQVILSVARLTKEKNMELGIHALSEMPENFVYLIIGSGINKTNLQTLAKNLNLQKRVIIIDFIEHRKIWEYYNIANVFWLLSKTDFEGTPNVIQEAFYAKVPVVVSNVSSMRNIVENNVNGIILDSFSPKELSNKTQDLILDKKVYKSFQIEGYKKVKSIIKQRFEIKTLFK